MTSLTKKLSQVVGNAFSAEGLPAELGAVRVADRPDLAQFQCNGAMAAARIAGKPPRAIAEGILGRLQDKNVFDRIEIAGPGFLNIKLTNYYIQNHLAEISQNERQGIDAVSSDTAVLDYGGPNIAKPMHVGHLRASIIGDSLRRICKFAGYATLGDVHMGDWGTHMGMIVSEYLKTGQAERIAAVDLNDAIAVEAFMNELSDLYPKVSAACKEDESRRAEALNATVQIQNREPAHYRLWEIIRNASVRGMKVNYATLGVHFDLWKGEADVHDLIAPMVEDLKKKNLAIESDGALIVPVAKEDDKKEIPPLILYKRDGAVMYGTTDLATIVERMNLYKPSKIVYVVDQRQNLHFEQVFRAARKSQIAPENTELMHAGFGTMNGTDGKPFKTRAGGVMKLEDLLAMAIEKAQKRLEEAELAKDIDQKERNDIARKVAIAAIKFADLQNNRIADYIFDIDRMISFEGKTGPYLLYQAVRIKSLLKKAGDFKSGQFILKDEDKPLALILSELPDHFDAALKSYTPHVLADHAFKLAQVFSSFYASCHILSETDTGLRGSRLALCDLTYRQLKLVLELLGIEIPERM